MPAFVVNVCRIAYAHQSIEIEAENLADAQEQAAFIEYGDHTYSEKDVDYEISGVWPKEIEPVVEPVKQKLSPLMVELILQLAAMEANTPCRYIKNGQTDLFPIAVGHLKHFSGQTVLALDRAGLVVNRYGNDDGTYWLKLTDAGRRVAACNAITKG